MVTSQTHSTSTGGDFMSKPLLNDFNILCQYRRLRSDALVSYIPTASHIKTPGGNRGVMMLDLTTPTASAEERQSLPANKKEWSLCDEQAGSLSSSETAKCEQFVMTLKTQQ